MWNYKVKLPAVSGTVILVCIQFLWIQEVSSVAFRRTSYQGRDHKQTCNVYVTEASGEEDCLRHCDELGYKCLHAANVDIVDECVSNPCVRGVCDNREGGYYCECPVGYTGVQCESVVTCPALSNPSHGSVTYSNRNIGSVATYSCGTGYFLRDNTPRTCETNGQWSSLAPTCLDLKNALDCADLYSAGTRSSGTYNVYPKDLNKISHEVQVYCDMTSSGGGWTMLQRRYDGSVSFALNWEQYKNGFGNIQGEYWLGNKYISMMTNSPHTKYRLRVNLTAFDGLTAYAEYSGFMVAPESDNFKLNSGTFIGGTAGDSLTYSNGMQFSTYDNDNDKSGGSCSQTSGGRGGFWYGSCSYANVNANYYTSPVVDHNAAQWYHWRGKFESMKGTIMAIRPKDF